MLGSEWMRIGYSGPDVTQGRVLQTGEGRRVADLIMELPYEGMAEYAVRWLPESTSEVGILLSLPPP